MTKLPALVPVTSSMASHAHYDEHAQSLTVQFKNGSTYRYDDIAHNLGHTVMNAASFGTSFNRHIKTKGVRL